jgi:hypothetical protein
MGLVKSKICTDTLLQVGGGEGGDSLLDCEHHLSDGGYSLHSTPSLHSNPSLHSTPSAHSTATSYSINYTTQPYRPDLLLDYGGCLQAPSDLMGAGQRATPPPPYSSSFSSPSPCSSSSSSLSSPQEGLGGPSAHSSPSTHVKYNR